MKHKIAKIFIPLIMIGALSGCSGIGAKAAGISSIYGTTAILSLLLLIGYVCLIPQRDRWFLLLFSSVVIVNVGYYSLSVSQNLAQALWANRLSYLGSVFLPMSMLMILLNVTKMHYRPWLPSVLFTICAFVLLVAASPGYLPIYYQEVSFEIVNGAGILHKVYGPWHSLYLIYLLAYFATMLAVVFHATAKGKMYSMAHSVILIIAVLVNLGVWFVEQLVHLDFEVLSVSYIISELFLLGLHLLIQEQENLKQQLLLQSKAATEAMMLQPTSCDTSTDMLPQSIISDAAVERFLEGVEHLTPTERSIYDFYITGTGTKEIMKQLNIKENTLKFHNKNLYGKLGVSSRKQLVAIYKHIQAGQETSNG